MENEINKIKAILSKSNLEAKKSEIRSLEAEAEKSDFWFDHRIASKKMKQLSSLQMQVKKLEQLEEWLLEVDLGMASESSKEIVDLVRELEDSLYLSGPHDSMGAIVSIHSGQGGTEAMDWAGMLHRMYSRFVERKGWNYEEIDFQPGEEAGIKEVAFRVESEFAYGILKHEAGVHRLVRQSPFNSDHLRQTSFALVEVVPILDDVESEIKIKDEDLEWDFFRSGGKGGQNVNKVSSAVRLTHKPSNVVVTCQQERSQEQNRNLALTLLRGKLHKLEEEKKLAEEMRLRGQHLTPGWGNQIRSYVLHPYHMVKDLRTDYEESNTDSVLDGNLENFIEAELHYFAAPD